ncbi:MAG TPA: TadE/TadG family type IV pilus assembly protein [Vicinamibacterales bacterium]|jgi:Flp pilus assembly protein TadG|nr:TadE/TadG family type IV pilus assembly protein [Vicinamibacterales bacterium]
MMKRFRNQRGAALIETAITIPLVLLVSVAIFEFGRAYQTWQVLTNAAREGARVAVLESYTDAQVTTIVQNYLTGGRLTNTPNIQVVRNVPFGSSTASRVTVNYPFQFMVIGPVAKLVRSTSKVGAPLTMQSSALMRNE